MRTRFLKIGVLVLALSPLLARAQFGSGIVYDPTQAAHALQQIEQGQNIFTNSVKLAKRSVPSMPNHCFSARACDRTCDPIGYPRGE